MHVGSRVLPLAALVLAFGAIALLACSGGDDGATEGTSADLSTSPAPGDLCVAREGEVCGTPAKIGCAAGLVCSASAPTDDGACVKPGGHPPANPAKPRCAPVRTAGGLCATGAGLTCASDLQCTFPFAGDLGSRPATGTCRLKAGGKCTFATRRLCGESMTCDFDAATDPDGLHGTCQLGLRCIDNASFGLCPDGMACEIVIDTIPDAVVNSLEACQMLPLAKQGEPCGGLVDAAICAPGLVCTKHLDLPTHSGTCDPPRDGGNGHFGLDGNDLLH